ncbi:MAG: hypothetical protein JKY66_11275 [Spongiibacteraceae bacterium]|nr:hypothetical protein [Spongiibacteraceae bacterium]
MKRIWIETKGGYQRFCYQTTKKAWNYNMTDDSVPPMDQPHQWNAVKYGTYQTMCVYAICPLSDYVEQYCIGKYATSQKEIGLFIERFFDRMDDDQRTQLGQLADGIGLGYLVIAAAAQEAFAS